MVTIRITEKEFKVLYALVRYAANEPSDVDHIQLKKLEQKLNRVTIKTK